MTPSMLAQSNPMSLQFTTPIESPELKQTKAIFSPWVFYLDLQKKYEANHVIDFAVACPATTKVPFVFVLNKKIAHEKE